MLYDRSYKEASVTYTPDLTTGNIFMDILETNKQLPSDCICRC